ncbi:MAG: hypothetical protein U0744_19505 [Gemmataceae bacterium]
MPLIIRCPNAQCAKSMQVPDGSAGKKVACPTCKTPFVIPAAAPTPAPAPAPVPVGATAAPATTTASSLSSSSPSIELSNGNRTTTANASSSTPTACPACGSKPLKRSRLHGLRLHDHGRYRCRRNRRSAEPLHQSRVRSRQSAGRTQLPAAIRSRSPAGTVLHGRYRLDKLLKMGGFGVYKATDTKSNNREVAIKDTVIGNDPQEFAIRLNFFRREAEILRSLETVPIVPRVFDFIHQGQTAHLVMEFIRGRDFARHLGGGTATSRSRCRSSSNGAKASAMCFRRCTLSIRR